MSLRAGVAAIVLAALGAAAAQAAPAPLSAYGSLPTIEQVAISPSGRLLAIDVVKGDQRTIVIQDIVAKSIVTGLRVGDVKIRQLEWAGDGHLIITSSATSGILGVLADRGEWFVASDFNVTTHRLTPLLGDTDNAGNMIDGVPMVRLIDGKPTLFATSVRFTLDEGMSTLFRIDLDTDHSSPVFDVGGYEASDLTVGADGRPAALAQYDAVSKKWTLKVWSSNSWRPAEAKVADIETPDVLGLGRDGHSILVGQYEDSHYTLRELSPDGAHFSDPLPGPSTGETISDPVSHRLLGMVGLDGDERHSFFYDPDDQLKWRAVEAAFPGRSVSLASWSDDRQRMVVQVDSPTDGPSYALVDLANSITLSLGGAYSGLGPEDISPVQAVRFKAADGLDISGYLTTPRGRDAKNLPLVVFPHGGPAARDEPGFDWWAQAMASRGYAVLQVNYRGSDGFGWDFMSAGFGQWGRKMQTDLSDGVRYLAGQGTIDPKRVCIVGASYGGYAALAGAAIDTGVYRCAVDVSGPAELSKFVAWARDRDGDHGGELTQRYWTRYMGADNLADPHLEAISPVDQADKVNIPVLIIHGKDDTVVPFEQSQMMADALKKAGKPYDFVILNHEDHWLSRSDTRLQMLQATVDFLEKNNPAS